LCTQYVLIGDVAYTILDIQYNRKEATRMGEENLARVLNAEKYENMRLIRCVKSFCVKLFRGRRE